MVWPYKALIARKSQGCDDMCEITTVLPLGLWRETQKEKNEQARLVQVPQRRNGRFVALFPILWRFCTLPFSVYNITSHVALWLCHHCHVGQLSEIKSIYIYSKKHTVWGFYYYSKATEFLLLMKRRPILRNSAHEQSKSPLISYHD